MNDASSSSVSAAATTTQSRSLGVYFAIVMAAVLTAAYYRLRADTIFGCQPAFSADQYISYCQADGYGDFDHGAFWFNLEPEATQSATKADVLLVGNSRMGYAFSSDAAQTWLSGNTSRYFLLAFTYFPQVRFQRAVLHKLNPKARVYIINLDNFFEENASVPAHAVMEDPGAQSRYRRKELWQTLQHAVCRRVAIFCGTSYGILRERHTGLWQMSGTITRHSAATFDEQQADAEIVARETPIGRKFLDSLGVDPRCVIFTLVPTVNTPSATSAAIAAALNVDFVSPELDDLLTFDGSHLDRPSAERWSAAFFHAAGKQIRDCLLPVTSSN